MRPPAPTLAQTPDGSYAVSSDLLPGVVARTVGYSSTGRDAVGGGAAAAATPALHRGLPSPYLTFIVTLNSPIVSGTTPEQAVSLRADRNEVLVAGLHNRPTFVVQTPTDAGIQLDVHPLAARAVFGVSTAELSWQVTEGADLLGVEADRVRQQLAEQPGWSERFAILVRYLGQRQEGGHHRAVRTELVEAWSWLFQRSGAGSMDALARHVALSPRQLRALFERELGIGPKQLARLMRFDVARRRLARSVSSGATVDLSRLAQRGGYYDHAHLDAEFREFAGASPRGWLAEERRNLQARGDVGPAD